MRYESRISPHHPTLGLIGATHPTLDIRQRSLHEGETHHSWNWAELPLQTEPKTSLSCNFLGLAGHTETEDKTDSIPPHLPSTSALLPRVKGCSQPPHVDTPLLLDLKVSPTVQACYSQESVCTACTPQRPPPPTHTPWDSAQPLIEAGEWHS